MQFREPNVTAKSRVTSVTHSPRCTAVAWHQLPCIPSRMPRAPCSARPALAPVAVAHSCLGARPTRRRPIASSLRLPCSWLTAVSVPSPQRHWHLLAAPALAAAPTHFALPGPPDARAPVLRPSNLAAGTALPLLLFVLFLAHAFLREARQEGHLVPPTLPWQVELSEGPPPAPPLLRRRPHNKTHFPLHRLS